MVNEVVLVGVIKQIEDKDEFKGKLFIQIEKHFFEGYSRVYDVVECEFWKSIHQKIITDIKCGDTLAIKGRIESSDYKFVVAIENIVLLNKSKNNILKGR